MAAAFWEGLRTFLQKEFWSFEVAHAVLGGALTVAGACGALFINNGLRERIATVDDQIAALDRRIETIGSVLAQFRVVQSNGVILGALSTNDAVRSEYREHFTNLMFVLRRGPALSLLGELHADDVVAFRRQRDELDELIAAAVAPNREKRTWDEFLEFEMSREAQVMEMQERFRVDRYRLLDERRNLESSVDTATMAGFILQQLGFVVILMAGLVHQHTRRGGTRGTAADTPG
jgi:hypothetical protein